MVKYFTTRLFLFFFFQFFISAKNVSIFWIKKGFFVSFFYILWLVNFITILVKFFTALLFVPDNHIGSTF